MRRKYAVLGTVTIVFGVVVFAVISTFTDATTQARQVNPDPNAPAPRLVIKGPLRDLGVIDPADKCRHVFVIRNEGDAPLKIAKAGTSCKCTVSVLPSKDIPPGMGGPIEIESKTEGIEGPFSHVAGFRTNDPKRPRFELRIEGEIRSYVVASPPSIYQADLNPDEPVEMSAMIFSEVWNDFTLENANSTIDGLDWELLPATPEQLKGYKAKSGYTVKFRLPASRAGNDFFGWIEFETKPTGEQEKRLQEKTRKIRVTLAGKNTSIRTVYGPLIDEKGVVHLGILRHGEPAKAYLLLKIRGEHREINVRKIEVTPDFLNVKVFAQTQELAKKGLYRIIIEIPRDALPGSYMLPGKMGTLRILTDHPDMPEIAALKVAFIVLNE